MSRRKPVFLIAGDLRSRHPGADLLLRKVLDSCVVSSLSVAYIGAANDDDRSFCDWTSSWLRKSGVGKVTLAPTVRSFERRFFEKTCESADAVFMSGGDVEAGMDVVTKRRLSPFLSELYRGGKLLFGLSAGSIMLARAWVRWRDDDDSSAILFPCLGMANVLCDVHGERDDWDELKALLRLSPGRSIGYGIRAGSAIRVDPDGTVEPMGKIDKFVKQGDLVRQDSR